MDATPTHAARLRSTPVASSVAKEDIALKTRFEALATRVGDVPNSQLNLPIAHWAVASDRCLPYALLDRTVGQILKTSLDNLLATPGVGRKKFASLVVLLQRALETAETPPAAAAAAVVEAIALPQEVFDAELVSQVMWAEWQETVRHHQLQDELIGRVAPSLQALPTVIWTKKLGEYLRYTIDELRSLKTHGEKRVTAVLEVFHAIHGLLGNSTRSARVVARLTPAFVPTVEQWLYGVLSSDELPTAQDLRQHLVLPLLNQIERDAGETVHRLAAGRLGIEALPEGVRDQALELRVTRARIYQLLETCGEVMRLRWPAGRWMFKLLGEKFQAQASDSEALALLDSLQRMLYPNRRAHFAVEPAIA